MLNVAWWRAQQWWCRRLWNGECVGTIGCGKVGVLVLWNGECGGTIGCGKVGVLVLQPVER